jgi:hypothetical protein
MSMNGIRIYEIATVLLSVSGIYVIWN